MNLIAHSNSALPLLSGGVSPKCFKSLNSEVLWLSNENTDAFPLSQKLAAESYDQGYE